MRRLNLIFALILAFSFLVSCQPESTSVPQTKLKFTYWGSDMEKNAIEGMVAKFESQNPDIDVDAIQLPYEDYLAQVNTMIADGKTPDVGYFPGLQAPQWGLEGKLLDLSDLVKTDPMFSQALPETRYYYGKDKIAGFNSAVETVVLFYNKDLFDKAGLPYPPSDPDKAWTWEQFVDTSRKLTMDMQGLHPGEEGFDSTRIQTFGAAFDKTYEGWTFYPFIFSNGGQVINEDGTQLLLDSPQSIQAIQNMADLMWVHHVTPTPDQDINLPGYVTMLQTGNLAMHISGQWSNIDYASVENLHYGIAVLPKLQKPLTVILGSPTVIFSGSKNMNAAVRFYKFHNNPEAVDLFSRGLWMPLQAEYYTNPDKIKTWLMNPAHPEESTPTYTTYVLNNTTPLPSYYIKNYAEILDKAIRPAFEKIWKNQASAEDALKEAVRISTPLMQGRWDR